MATLLNPYLHFDGDAREAMEFYGSVFGAEPNVMTFESFMPEGSDGRDRVMHAQLDAPNGFVLMGADTPPGSPLGERGGYTISLSGDDESTLRGYWDKLSEGGNVEVPLEKQMWGDTFGQFTDRFGISWLVNIAGEQS